MNRDFITCELHCNTQFPRYYVVYRIKYDFESGGWFSVLELDKTKEIKKYGTFEAAKKYATSLYNKYKKELGEDLEVIIKDELIDIDKILKEKEKAEKSVKYYNDLLQYAIEELAKDNDNCYFCKHRNELTCPHKCPEIKQRILGYLKLRWREEHEKK